MSTQIKKQMIGMSGEFAVCAELLKRQKQCSVTYGQAKAIDIIVTNINGVPTCKTIEVKTTRNTRVVTNFFKKYPSPQSSPHPDYWVLVNIDENNQFQYYILTHDELAQEQMKRNNTNIWSPNKKGVDNLLFKNLAKYKDQWNKIQ